MVNKTEIINEITVKIKPGDRNAHTALLLAFLEVNGSRGYAALKKYGYEFTEFDGLDKLFLDFDEQAIADGLVIDEPVVEAQ
jgi:hypothetical protein